MSATPGYLKPKTAAPWKGCEESSTPRQGAGRYWKLQVDGWCEPWGRGLKPRDYILNQRRREFATKRHKICMCLFVATQLRLGLGFTRRGAHSLSIGGSDASRIGPVGSIFCHRTLHGDHITKFHGRARPA